MATLRTDKGEDVPLTMVQKWPVRIGRPYKMCIRDRVKDGLFVKRRLVTEKEFLGGGLEAQAKTVTQDVGERLRTLSGIQTEMSQMCIRDSHRRG